MKHIFRAGDKPLDFGHGGISGCLTRTGRFVAINHYHPVHGYVTLSSAPPFPDEARYDPARVRQYRRDVVTQDGFGVALSSDVVQTVVEYNEYDSPILTMTLANGATVRCVTHIFSYSTIFQDWEFSEPTAFLIAGRVWVMRCAYPQLTEGGVLPPVSHVTLPYMYMSDEIVGVHNPAIQWGVALEGLDGLAMHTDDGGCTHLYAQMPMQTAFTWTMRVLSPYGTPPPTPIHNGNAQYGLAMASPYDPPSLNKASPYDSQANISPLSTPVRRGVGVGLIDDPIYTRAWRYARLCATPTEHDTLCILTDHMILPLSWNRDSYYAARLFLDDPQSVILTQKHLLWLFETAERINGVWGRSYLANGKIKDRGFQLDQQLFPLLELAEYVQITGDTALLDRLRHHIRPVFEALRAYRAPHALLYATEETPADDPIALPYPLSSHILLWRVLSELEKIGCGDLSDLSPNDVARSIMTHFIATPPDGDAPLFAYATDGAGKHHFYHDANDVPLALMPAWHFCPANDPVWRATMDFAFSPANVGGFYDGSLGSVHTPAPWALGDIQEWIFARAIGDEVREQAVLSRLQHASQWDGALPEAYEAGTGAVVSRHWFLWTNAFYACVKRGIFDVKP